jgi:GntR family transcriptional repressor for pyruvate dehydrogenase complex
MQIQTVKVQRLYLQVAQQLIDLIDKGSIAAGQRLPSERDLAGKFGVSRPTIREAMIALEIAEVVEIRSGSGVYVLPRSDATTPSATDQGPGPFEILEARRLIESEACALAAVRISDQQLAQLGDLLQAIDKENKQANTTEQADEQFHRCIAEAAGNSAISATISWLWDLRNESEISTRFHKRLRAEGVKPIVADHKAILQALHEHDADAARKAMNNHLQRVIDDLLAHQ